MQPLDVKNVCDNAKWTRCLNKWTILNVSWHALVQTKRSDLVRTHPIPDGTPIEWRCYITTIPPWFCHHKYVCSLNVCFRCFSQASTKCTLLHIRLHMAGDEECGLNFIHTLLNCSVRFPLLQCHRHSAVKDITLQIFAASQNQGKKTSHVCSISSQNFCS